MSDREKLIAILETPGTMEHTADALIAAGWRLIPTEGPEFEAMVGRAAEAEKRVLTWGADGESQIDLERRHHRRRLESALLAALGDRTHG